MRDFKIALVQHNSPVRTKQANLDATVDWVRKAGEKGAGIVCFPELNITGHAGHPAMIEQAESVPKGKTVQTLCRLAAELDIYICAGIAEKDRGIYYNTQFIVGPNGYIGKQRKVHLSRDEYFYFRGGTRLPVLELPFARLGIVICYDNLVPEVSRSLAVKGAEVLLCPHAARTGKWSKTVAERRRIVEENKREWRKIHRARAYDNGCYVALVNAAGRAAVGLKGVEANHAGGCMIINPNGEVIAESRSKDIRDEMLVVQLDGKAVAKKRQGKCFNLQTRRPEVFAVLCEPTE